MTRRLSEAAHERLSDTGWDIFVGPGEVPSRPRLIWAAGGAVGLIATPTETIDAEVMDRCPGLRVISQGAATFANIDFAEAERRGVLVRTSAEDVQAVEDLIAALQADEA